MISCLNGRTAWRLNSNFKLKQNFYPRTNSVGKNRNTNVRATTRTTSVIGTFSTTSKPIARSITRTRTQTEPGKYREPKIILKPFGESDKP